MNEFLIGLVGALIPTAIMLGVYACSIAGRLAKIETDICWIKKEIKPSQLRSNVPTL